MTVKNAEELQKDVDDLQTQLIEAKRLQEEAANFGLKLLEEKQNLEYQLSSSDKVIQNLRLEIDQANQKLHEQTDLKRKISEAELVHEQAEASALQNRENYHKTCIKQLELDLKSLKQKYERQITENDKLHSTYAEISSKLEHIEADAKKFKLENEELKAQNLQLTRENLDVAGENVELQKVNMRLKMEQYQFDNLKHDNKKLDEEIEILNSQLEEATKNKLLTDQYLEEALNETTRLEGEEDKKTETSLFSELQSSSAMDDLRELKEENATIKAQLERATSELTAKTEKIHSLKSQLDLIQDMNRKGDQEFEEPTSRDLMTESFIASQPTDPEEKIMNLLRALRRIECRYSVATQQILSLQQDLWQFREKEKLINRPELQTEKGRFEEIVKLQAELEEKGVRIKSLETKLDEKSVDKLTDKHLKSLHKTLNSDLTEVLDIYALVLNSIDEKPSKQVVELAERLGLKVCFDLATEPPSPDTSLSSESTSQKNEIETVDGLLSLCEGLRPLLTSLRHVLYILREKSDHNAAGVSNAANDLSEKDRLKSQLAKLMADNTTKREQIATMRKLISSNKLTAENALANLKQRYENDKLIFATSMQALRKELKAIKESTQAQNDLRTTFCQRIDELNMQSDEYQVKLLAAEEEKRTVNSLLRLAIQQKLALTQRLEELEMAREVTTPFFNHPP
ncbi:hypothetical protein Ciccas_007322, partial [Cichlidogyrus casuarinus]